MDRIPPRIVPSLGGRLWSWEQETTDVDGNSCVLHPANEDGLVVLYGSPEEAEVALFRERPELLREVFDGREFAEVVDLTVASPNHPSMWRAGN